MSEFIRDCNNKWVEGFYINILSIDNDKIVYEFPHDSEKEYTAQFNLCKWARGLHGNAPTGTYYGNYRIKLPNGKRVLLKRYI
jgi:hypothetical protein